MNQRLEAAIPPPRGPGATPSAAASSSAYRPALIKADTLLRLKILQRRHDTTPSIAAFRPRLSRPLANNNGGLNASSPRSAADASITPRSIRQKRSSTISSHLQLQTNTQNSLDSASVAFSDRSVASVPQVAIDDEAPTFIRRGIPAGSIDRNCRRPTSAGADSTVLRHLVIDEGFPLVTSDRLGFVSDALCIQGADRQPQMGMLNKAVVVETREAVHRRHSGPEHLQITAGIAGSNGAASTSSRLPPSLPLSQVFGAASDSGQSSERDYVRIIGPPLSVLRESGRFAVMLQIGWTCRPGASRSETTCQQVRMVCSEWRCRRVAMTTASSRRSSR